MGTQTQHLQVQTLKLYHSYYSNISNMYVWSLFNELNLTFLKQIIDNCKLICNNTHIGYTILVAFKLHQRTPPIVVICHIYTFYQRNRSFYGFFAFAPCTLESVPGTNQLLLSNEGTVSCSRKQREPLIGVELKSDRHTPITSQTPYQMPHAAFNTYLF